MLHIQAITSLDVPGLGPYRTLRRHEEHREQRIFVAEGEKTLRRLLETRFVIVSLLMTEEWLGIFTPLLQTRSESIEVYIAPKPILEELIGYSMFQGIMAVARIPESPTLAEIVGRNPKSALMVATDGVDNAENLGTLVRNCSAFSVDGLLVSQSSSSPFLRRAVRSSMGGIFRLPVLEKLDLVETLGELRKQKVQCIAAHPRAGSKALGQMDLTSSCCLVFGNEANGISPKVLAACDEAVAIPMPANVDSLNISNAAAVFLYEVRRQRGEV